MSNMIKKMRTKNKTKLTNTNRNTNEDDKEISKLLLDLAPIWSRWGTSHRTDVRGHLSKLSRTLLDLVQITSLCFTDLVQTFRYFITIARWDELLFEHLFRFVSESGVGTIPKTIVISLLLLCVEGISVDTPFLNLNICKSSALSFPALFSTSGNNNSRYKSIGITSRSKWIY